ncbi:MAG: ATP-binding protein [Desulfarculales bacterium]|jgi:DNA replication protein DnaC|nr:ATP-binding protein [Desulfarculales bacterium]
MTASNEKSLNLALDGLRASLGASPHEKCPRCGRETLAKAIEALGSCYDCHREREQRREKLDWLRQESGLSAQEWRLSFASLQPWQHPALIRRLRVWRAENGKGLYIAGGLGVGKTHLAVCLLNQHIRSGPQRGMFLSYPRIFADLKADFGARRGQARQVLSRARGASLLVIDDLGAGAAPGWAESEFLPLLDWRAAERLPTVYTSNLALNGEAGLEMLSRAVSARLYDRIAGGVENPALLIMGRSLRGREVS